VGELFLSKKIIILISVALVIILSVAVTVEYLYLKIFHESYKIDDTHYTANAVWIQNSDLPRMNPHILENNFTSVLINLKDSHIKFAFVFVGYWNSTSNDIDYSISDELITTTINGLHGINVTVLAWAENADANLNVTATNRNNLYSSIMKCVNKGFDGYNDDVEGYKGTLQDWINYLNNATLVLHGSGKLMTADVAFDWQQNMNPYLKMDYIVTMFYNSKSALESREADIYWEENFGQYVENNSPPASPVILGIMNYYGNAHPLSWQLQKLDQLLSNHSHPMLEGFSIWLYEYMGTNPGDWQQWNNWIASQHV
jgi:hypothetical protein